MCFVNGVEWEMTRLVEANWKSVQKKMQFVNSNVCSLRRLGTHGRLGNRNKISRRNLEDSSHWILYFLLSLCLSLSPNSSSQIMTACSSCCFLYVQDYGVNKQVSEKIGTDADSQLAPALVELMKMLFNVETYRFQKAISPFLILYIVILR